MTATAPDREGTDSSPPEGRDVEELAAQTGSGLRILRDDAPASSAPVKPRRRSRLGLEEYVSGIAAGERSVLARAITLVESGRAEDEPLAQQLLKRLLPLTGKAKRVGITGVPGVGKSTFIEALGCHLCESGRRVAVLAVDPTSARTGGSILGDKTRMERLFRQEHAFIRPSPAGRTLGGVARKTRETSLLCEAAGFDVLLIETVGVGQSEIAVRSMVDFFLLLILPGAGDELQGIKRGIVEQADALLVNKADGDNRRRAEQAQREYALAIHYATPSTPPWTPSVGVCSALTGEGITEFWAMVERYYRDLGILGIIDRLRRKQSLAWLDDLIREELVARFQRAPGVVERRQEVEAALMRGELTAPQAAFELLRAAQIQDPNRLFNEES